MDPSMQAAYQSFLLQGGSGSSNKKNKKNKSKNNNNNTNRNRPPTTPPPTTPDDSPYVVATSSGRRDAPSPSSTTGKGRQQHERVLQKILQDYQETDEILYQLVSSVVNLQERLVAVQQHWQQRIDDDNDDTSTHCWQDCGYRQPSNRLHLEEDLQLALNHTLLRHESMLQQIRSQLAQQSQTVDAASRRLELFLSSGIGEFVLVRTFRSMAADLWTKQQSLQELLQASGPFLESRQARRVAPVCQKEWKAWKAYDEGGKRK